MTATSTPGVPGRRRTLRTNRPVRLTALLVLLTALVLAGCGTDPADGADDGTTGGTLVVGAIPDQDPQKLQRLYGAVVDHLSRELDLEVEYRPVTDYTAAVSLFRTGDLQLVWFGGLTGVQARLQTPGAVPLVQRDIDSDFHSLFIANRSAGIGAVRDVAGLSALADRRFTYGSQSSTSGYLMPAHFLTEAGVDPQRGFAGEPGFSGSHDRTIDLVTSGTFEAGVVNEQVWTTRLAAGTVDRDRVEVVLRTPPYADYHWLLGPTALERFGPDVGERISRALEDLDAADPADAQVLSLFGAQRFVPTSADRYDTIEQVGRRLGLVNTG